MCTSTLLFVNFLFVLISWLLTFLLCDHLKECYPQFVDLIHLIDCAVTFG